MAEAGLFGGSEGSRKMVTGGLWPEERREDRRCNIELPTSNGQTQQLQLRHSMLDVGS